MVAAGRPPNTTAGPADAFSASLPAVARSRAFRLVATPPASASPPSHALAYSACATCPTNFHSKRRAQGQILCR